MSLVSKVICDVCGSESGIPDRPSTWGAQGKVEIRFGGSLYLASSYVDLCKRCYVEMQGQLREWLASMPPCFRGVKAKPADIAKAAGPVDFARQTEELLVALNDAITKAGTE